MNPGTVTLTREQFLEIELAVTKLSLFETRAAQARQQFLTARAAAMEHAGLDLAQTYQIDPITLIATPQAPRVEAPE